MKHADVSYEKYAPGPTLGMAPSEKQLPQPLLAARQLGATVNSEQNCAEKTANVLRNV